MASARTERWWRYPQEHPLGYRMLLHVLLCSLAFIMLSTALQLWAEYRREMQVIDQRIALIRSGYLAGMARSVWDVDREQLELQMRGILYFPDVRAVSLASSTFDAPLLLESRPARPRTTK